jgi:hypothetical protein
MNSLDQAVDRIMRGPGNRQQDRAGVQARLEAVIGECEAAVKVWQGYLNAPGDPGDHWTIVSWVGADRARRLHEISLRAREQVEQIGEAAGPAVGRFIAYDEGVIETAYRQLKPGETGIEAAKTAIGLMNYRIAHLRGLIELIRRAPSAKISTIRPASKKTAVRKIAAKKTVKKSAKPKK